MASAPPTIITKVLLPNKRPTLLDRPRLVDFCHENIDRKIILVSAGAGYGKTSLLTDYAHQTDLPVCWLSLDEGDQDLPVFVDYLLSAIKHRFPDFGRRTTDLLRSGSATLDARALVASLSYDIYQDIPGYFVLILDDYQLIDSSIAANSFLDLLLRHLPENCHIILSSRGLPTKLSITRLVARQEISGLGVTDLRFTAAEIRALIQQNYDLEMSPEQAEELAQHSEGWITGILLTSHNLWKGLFKNIIQVRGDEGQVFDYLANEVFGLQDESLRDFLIRSSVVERMEAGLCNALLGIDDAGATLRALEQQNLFTIQLDDNWYRYHHLFRAFLAAKGIDQSPREYQALRAQAGGLLARRGSHSEALALFLESEHWDEAAEQIQEAAPNAWEHGQWSTLARWIDQLPGEVARRYPWLAYFRGKIHLEAGEFALSAGFFRQAKAEFANMDDQIGLARTLVEEGFVFNHSGDYDQAVRNSKEAITALDSTSPIYAGRAHRALGSAYVMQGNTQAAIKEHARALALYERLDRAYDIALVHHDLGLAYERIGNLGRSKVHLVEALKYWDRVNNVSGMANTLNSLGVIQHSEGLYAEALETLERALDNIRLVGVPLLEAYVLASLGDLYRELGDSQQSLGAYEQALEIGKRRDLAFVTLYTLLAMGNMHSLQGNLDAASYCIDQAGQIASSHSSSYNEALHLVAHGIWQYRSNELPASAESLQRAIKILRASGAKIELTRAYLHLAQASLLSGKMEDVDAALQAVAETAAGLDQVQFLVAEARNLPQLVEYGAQQRIGRPFFRDIATRLSALLRLQVSDLRKQQPLEEEAATSSIESYAFGNSFIVRDGQPLSNADWGATIAKELFFYLLDYPQGLRKDQIIDAFWSDTTSSKGNSHFHSTIYQIRRAIGPDCLVREGGSYRVELKMPHFYDAAEFQRLVDAAAASPESMERCYRKAVALYRDDYMADTYSDWCAERRESLRQTYLSALTALADHYAELERYAECVVLARRALKVNPYEEKMHRLIMFCCAQAGNRAEAIKSYQECAHLLQDELGVTPSLETRSLFESITTSSQ